MTKEELSRVREWADIQIASADLPAIWYQLMKLREALDAIIIVLDSIPLIAPEDRPHPSRGSGPHLRLVDNDVRDAGLPD